ncbi:MAG: hypothetical protein II936_05855 [Oscillospiraceae bacterium]|nr:hypothetical protein [Oscillospiraceae bacterium]
MEKNKDKVSVWDAYRIYNGKGFLKSVLRTLLIGAVVLAAASSILALFEVIELDNGSMIDFGSYLYENTLVFGAALPWFLLLVRKLGNSDRSDKNAPGGKYFCTVKGRGDTFAKAHILTTAESVFTVFIICLIYALGYMINYTDSIRKIDPSYQIPAEDIYYMLIVPSIYVCICALLPLALSNLIELLPYRSYRTALIFTAFLYVPFILLALQALQVKIVNTAEFEAVTQIVGTLLWIILLIVSEYLVIRKHSSGIADDTASTQAA